MGEKFESFLQNKYGRKEDFQKTIERHSQESSSTDDAKINDYLEKLERVLESERWRETFKKISLYPRFIIKPENIKDEYLKEILLGNFAEQKGYTREQLKDEQIRNIILEQFKEEYKISFDDYSLSGEERKQEIERIIEDQKNSLNQWLNYLLSDEVKKRWPKDFRYWVFGEVVKLGAYNQKEKVFNKRTETTVAPFPELNPQALAIVIDEIIRKYQKEASALIPSLNTEEEKQKFKELLERENFNELYSWALNYVKSLKLPVERLPIIEGEWRVFSKGSDPQELVKVLAGYNTGWCIAGYGTAQAYLSNSDIHIFFSQDKDGNSVIPRAAIVVENNEITEVRGIASSQNLDQYITPVVEDKLKQLPSGEKYLKRTEQMKKLAEIYLKHKQNIDLSIEDLIFLYELDEKIEGFGFSEDPRIDEIRKGRDVIKDLNQIFSSVKTEIKGSLDLSFLTSAEGLELPEEIEVSLVLSRLTSAKGLKIPQKIGGRLDLSFLTSAEGLELPEEIGGDLKLFSITSAKGLKLPQKIGINLYLSSLTSAEELELPQEIGGGVFLSNKIPFEEQEKLKKKYPHLRFEFAELTLNPI